jgi:hypothetical protein
MSNEVAEKTIAISEAEYLRRLNPETAKPTKGIAGALEKYFDAQKQKSTFRGALPIALEVNPTSSFNFHYYRWMLAKWQKRSCVKFPIKKV